MNKQFYTLIELADSKEFVSAYEMLEFLATLEKIDLVIIKHDLSEIVDWCKENSLDFGTYVPAPSSPTRRRVTFYFVSKDDAMRFKLTWC